MRVLLCLLAFATACSAAASTGSGSGSPRPGDPPRDPDGHDRDAGAPPSPDPGPASCGAPIDVVFVIDVSQSMGDEIARVRTGMQSIWETARALTPDSRFGLVVFIDDVLVVGGCTPFASIDAMREEFSAWERFTDEGIQPGGSPGISIDCPENSLDALYAAATECAWRDDATKLVIHVTDDTFAEAPAVLNEEEDEGGVGIPVRHRYDETVAALVERGIRVGSFAIPDASDCSLEYGEATPVGPGFHADYHGRPSIPEATQGRAWSLRDVASGAMDMSEVINVLIEDAYCSPLI